MAEFPQRGISSILGFPDIRHLPTAGDVIKAPLVGRPGTHLPLIIPADDH
jgi:hypothetical protein